MNIVFWIIQILIAAVFLTTGAIKLVFPKNKLDKTFYWIDDFSQNKIRIIATFEIIGALGLFLPGVYPISELIIPLSAAGLSIVMVLAALSHYNRGKRGEMVVNIMVTILLVFVIIGRFVM